MGPDIGPEPFANGEIRRYDTRLSPGHSAGFIYVWTEYLNNAKCSRKRERIF